MNELILNGMAKAFFATAWADQVELSDNPDKPNMSGCEIMDIMPDEIDPAAMHAARTLFSDYTRALRVDQAEPTLALDGTTWISLEGINKMGGATTQEDLELFGHYIAMQAMGTGVGLYDFDITKKLTDHVPHVEFGCYSLEKDYV